MKVKNYDERMLRRKRVRGIIAVIAISGAIVLGMLGYGRWFYALVLLGLSFLFSFLYFSTINEKRTNLFHALRIIFGALFVGYAVMQLINLLIQLFGG